MPRRCRTVFSPLVVPQLKTITVGGAVTGLGIESASFRNGLPHESVLEMDMLTGSGEIVTRHADRRSFRSVLRLPQFLWEPWLLDPVRIELEPVKQFVALRAPAVLVAG